MKKNLRKQGAIVSCLYIGEICVGSLAWSSPVIPILQDAQQTPLSGIITEQEASWIGAASLPGILIGASISGWLSNVFGRKPCLSFGGLIFMISYLLLATAQEFWMIIAGRFLNGVGVGIVYLTNLTYIAEISSTHTRGMFLTATGIFTSLGVLIIYAIGPFFSFVGIMYTAFFESALFTMGTIFIPETPVFHVLKGKELDAKRTLLSLGRSEDLEEVLSSKPFRPKTKVQGLRDLFLVQTNRRALFVGLFLFGCQGLSGYLTVTFQVTPIFQSVNSSINPGLATIIVGVTQLLASCVTPLFVDRFGRKVLLMISTAGCSISMALLGIYFIFHPANGSADETSSSSFHWIPLLSLMFYLISYLSGFFTIPGAYASEIFDSSSRGPGCTITLVFGSLICFAITSLYGYINLYLGSFMNFFIYAAASACACAFVSLFVVETKGKSLAEVQLLLSK